MSDLAPEAAPRADAGAVAFADAAETLAGAAAAPDQRLSALAGALAAAAAADTVVVRLLDDASGRLVARGVVSSSAALAGELEGSAVDAHLGAKESSDADRLAPALGRLWEQAGATAVFVTPIRLGERVVGAIELLRDGRAFSEPERVLARLAAGQVSMLVGAGPDGEVAEEATRRSLELLGEALAAGEGGRVAQAIVRLGARAVGARAGLLWELGGNGAPPRVIASWGFGRGEPLEQPPPVVPPGRAVSIADAVPGVARGPVVATVALDEARTNALQLFLTAAPAPPVVDALATFAGRAGQALRTGRRAEGVAAELERTRDLLGIVGQAIAELSLSHTLETVADRVGELLATSRVAVYLHDDDKRLRSREARGLAGPHEEVAAALYHLALGPLRARGAIVVEDAGRDPRLASASRAIAAAGVEAAVAVPLAVPDEEIGLLVAYLPRGRVPSDDESATLVALAAQLGVAMQNAKLHEAKIADEQENARLLEAERKKAWELEHFYRVSESFTTKMSFAETLSALVRNIAELVRADAAVIRTHDRRRNALVPNCVHVVDESLRPVVQAMLDRPHPLETDAARALVEDPRPQLITRASARKLGEAYELLAPFLERGGSAAIVPVARAGELIAAVTVVSLDPERSLGEEALAAASKLAAQAALAVDNARLYQQQQDFLHAMQRALLPQSLPEVRGLEVASAYEPGGRLEVGGDVYDFLELGQDRLAVVLGDVTGHGAEAAADMAMAKFVFRSLAREHPDPGDFLAAANDVVAGEIALGKFVTMVYLVADGRTGEVRCAVAGHPPPRVVRADRVEELGATGVALGVEPNQRYEEVSISLGPGDALLLYTDGVIEARCNQELYGMERLDRALREATGGSAEELGSAVLEDCRAFAGGELDDDCAIVVIRRLPQR